MKQLENTNKKRISAWKIIQVSLLIMMVVTIFSTFYFKQQLNKAKEIEKIEYQQYERHYALISNNSADTFWESVYAGAKEEGEKSRAYIERLGNNLPVSYSKEELMRIAIASKVDGIILEADDSIKTSHLIADAVKEGIPVVTVLSDGYGSLRQSFIGINSYNLGQEYARQVIRIAGEDTKLVNILTNSNANNTEQNIIFSGIKETIEKEAPNLNRVRIEMAAINNDAAFSAEESIRDLFLKAKELPDIVICLNELNTISAYQAVVDYNMVGKINLIGYYDSDKILNAIQENIISATIAIDTKQMGKMSVEALDEFIETGYVSDYISVDTSIVTAENVERYREDVSQADEK